MDSLVSVPPNESDSVSKTHHGKPQKPGRISPARLEANRRNAQKSTGPKTPEGKAIARQNPLKHGLSGAGFVVHPLDEEPLRIRLEDWTRDLDPQDSVEGWMVGRASLASVRVDRCAVVERACQVNRIKNAANDWLKNARCLAEDYSRGLESKPQATLSILLGRAIGCEWLIAAWDEIGQTLQTRGFLSEQDLNRALRLLGQSSPPQATAAGPLVPIWAAGLVLQSRLDLDEVDRFRGRSTAKLPPRERQAECRKDLPALEEARTTWTNLIQSERDHLSQRAQVLWTDVDGPERQNAEERALFDPSETAEKMARYEKSNSSEVHRFLNTLSHKRKEESYRAERRAASSERRRTFRKKVAKEVIALLKSRRSRREEETNGAASRLATVLSNGNGKPDESAAEPFVMPKPLSERMAESVVGNGAEMAPSTSQPPAPAVQKEAKATVSDVLTSSPSACSGESPGGAAASACVAERAT
jgi:hypothetical protein